MKNQIVRRGYVPSDEYEFSEKSMHILKNAQKDIFYLLEKGYPIKSATTYVGNHYLLSERQRIALARATHTSETIKKREQKKVTKGFKDQHIYIDGLNLIITLEVALSKSTLIWCMDETIRDLAGLRGTYRLIDKTDKAIELIGQKLTEMKIKEVDIFLDSPVSNTGRLKTRLYELLEPFPVNLQVELVNNADVKLVNKYNVVSSDSIVLNNCCSWINVAEEIILKDIKDANIIDLRLQ